MEPATFNEYFPDWDKAANLYNWSEKLEDTLQLLRDHQGQDGTIGTFAKSVYNRLLLLPIELIMGYSNYTDTLKSFIGRDSLSNKESYLLLTLDAYLSEQEKIIYSV